MYPLHTSSVMLRPSSLASRLYLIHVFLIVHRYDDAAMQISASFSDTALSPDEKLLTEWILSPLNSEQHNELHPDALACLLRVVVLCLSSGAEPFGSNFSKLEMLYSAYLVQFPSVSLLCRLERVEQDVLERKLLTTNPLDSQPSSPENPGALKRSMRRVLQVCVSAFNAGPPLEKPHSLKVIRRSEDCCEVAWEVANCGAAKTSESSDEIARKATKDYNTLEHTFLTDMAPPVPPILGVHIELWDTMARSWRLLLPKNLSQIQAESDVERQQPSLEDVSLSGAKVIGLNSHQTYSLRIRAVNRIGLLSAKSC